MGTIIALTVSIRPEQKVNSNQMKVCVTIVSIVTTKATCLRHITKYLSFIRTKNLGWFHLLSLQTRNPCQKKSTQAITIPKKSSHLVTSTACSYSLFTHSSFDKNKSKHDFCTCEYFMKQVVQIQEIKQQK